MGNLCLSLLKLTVANLERNGTREKEWRTAKGSACEEEELRWRGKRLVGGDSLLPPFPLITLFLAILVSLSSSLPFES